MRPLIHPKMQREVAKAGACGQDLGEERKTVATESGEGCLAPGQCPEA